MKNIHTLIFNYLNNKDILTFRLSSTKANEVVKSSDIGKKMLSPIFKKEFRAANFLESRKIQVDELHSDGKDVRFIFHKEGTRSAHQIAKIHFHPFQIDFTPLSTIVDHACWRKDKVAFLNDGTTNTLPSIEILEIETGNKLNTLIIPSSDPFYHLRPIDWIDDHQLLLFEQKKSSASSTYAYTTYLSLWNVESDNTLPQEFFSFSSKDSQFDEQKNKIKVGKHKEIFFQKSEAKPFWKLDSQYSDQSLNYEINPENYFEIKNFDVSEGNNLFFSLKNTFTLLDENGFTKLLIELPLTPSYLTFQFPFMVCCQDYTFMVYDIRKPDQPVYQLNYLTSWEKFRTWTSLQAYMPFSVPYFEQRIRGLALQDSNLLVKRSENLDYFDLAAAPAWYSFSNWF